MSDFTARSSDWYREHDIDLRLGSRVSAVDAAAPTVLPSDGTPVPYAKLLLATGSASRRPPIPGSDAPGVHYLRSYEDAAALNAVLTEGSSLAGLDMGDGGVLDDVKALIRSQNSVDIDTLTDPRSPLADLSK